MSDNFSRVVGLVIPTYNAGRRWSNCLCQVKNQDLTLAKILVIDSSSTDQTAALAEAAGLDVNLIAKESFNHGGTRQYALSQLIGVDVVIYLTQDALLTGPHSLTQIIAPFIDPAVAAVCGRQLPHHDANPLAAHARSFNYPWQQTVKSLEDASRYGLKTAFISNSFAAYRVSALNDVGGFPSDVILAEDMYVAAKMLAQGWKIAYAGDATCYHSHNYTPWQEFQRYFDTGVFHAREPWIRELLGGAGGEGMRYVISELKSLGLKNLHWWPASLLSNSFKLAGYKLGQLERWLPVALKRRLSMHAGYWE